MPYTLKKVTKKEISVCSNKLEFNTIDKTNLCICNKIAIILETSSSIFKTLNMKYNII